MIRTRSLSPGLDPWGVFTMLSGLSPLTAVLLVSWSSPSYPQSRSDRVKRTSRPTTPSTSTASRCGTASSCSRPSTCPRTTSQTYPILLTRTPYSVRPYGVDQYQADLRPVAAVRQGGLHLRLPGRARPLDVGRRVRQHAAAQRRQEGGRGHRRKHRHLRHDRLAGQERAEQQRQGRACGASRTPASTRRPA